MRKFCNKIGVYSKKGKIKKTQVLEWSQTSIRFYQGKTLIYSL